MSLLELKELKAKVEDKEILKGLNLNINKGEVHVIMGPNGAGKSTLASVLVGHPKYEISGGDIIFDGEEINDLAVDERAQKGMFLSFQYPEEIPGLTVEDFLRAAKEAVSGEKQYFMQFHQELVRKNGKTSYRPYICRQTSECRLFRGRKKEKWNTSDGSSGTEAGNSGWNRFWTWQRCYKDSFRGCTKIRKMIIMHFL